MSAEVPEREQDELLDELLDAKSGIDAARKCQFRIFKLQIMNQDIQPWWWWCVRKLEDETAEVVDFIPRTKAADHPRQQFQLADLATCVECPGTVPPFRKRSPLARRGRLGKCRYCSHLINVFLEVCQSHLLLQPQMSVEHYPRNSAETVVCIC